MEAPGTLGRNRGSTLVDHEGRTAVRHEDRSVGGSVVHKSNDNNTGPERQDRKQHARTDPDPGEQHQRRRRKHHHKDRDRFRWKHTNDARDGGETTARKFPVEEPPENDVDAGRRQRGRGEGTGSGPRIRQRCYQDRVRTPRRELVLSNSSRETDAPNESILLGTPIRTSVH